MTIDLEKQDKIFELLRKHDVFRFSYTEGGQTVEFFPKKEDYNGDPVFDKKVEDDFHEIRKREKMLEDMKKEF